MHEIIVNVHMHTRYSDGSGTHKDIAHAALQTGVGAVIVTDHNVLVQGVEGYYRVPPSSVSTSPAQRLRTSRVLLLVGAGAGGAAALDREGGLRRAPLARDPGRRRRASVQRAPAAAPAARRERRHPRHRAADRDGGLVRIEAERKGPELRIVISNPRDADAPARRGTGIGLQNVKRRLAALHGAEAELQSTATEDTFRVELRLPVKH